MTNSSRYSEKSFRSRAVWTALIVSALGIADATYLTAEHYLGGQVSCSLLKGCETVLSSEYSKILGFPVSLLGVAYYVAIFLSAYAYKLSPAEVKMVFVRSAAATGLAASAYFVYLQVAVIGAICQYCMLSAGLTTILSATLLADWLFARSAEKNIENA